MTLSYNHNCALAGHKLTISGNNLEYMDETLVCLVRAWHYFGISDHNWTCPAEYPKHLRTFLRTFRLQITGN